MLVAIVERMRFVRSFRSRPFTFIWLGQTISNLGDGIFNVALAWQVLLMTHSGTAMGLVLIASTVPRLAFGLLGGVASDRLPRRMIILWSDGGRGAIVLLISLLGFMGYLQFLHLLVESLIFGVVDSFFTPAIMAITPDLVEKEHLASANALNSFSGNLAQLFGPALGALLIALFTPIGAFFVNALSFFVSVAFLFCVPIPERHVAMQAETAESDSTALATTEEPAERRRGFRGVVADVQEGLVYVRSSRWLWVSILGMTLGNIGIMATLAVAMPKLVHDVYMQGPWLLGLIGTTEAVGSILALILIGQATRLKRRGLMAYLSMCLTCIGLFVFGLPFPRGIEPSIAVLASILVGFGIAFFNTIWFTILHETIPSDKLGRVISLDYFGSFAMTPIGEGLGGVLTDHLGPAQVFVFFGLFNLVLTASPLLVKEIRRME